MPHKDLRHKDRIYRIWKKMKSRCNDPNNDAYKYYGSKGIKVHREWTIRKQGFLNFKEWALNNGYKDNLTIDRRDSSQGYSPENCRWITTTLNSRYKSSTKLNTESVKIIRELYASGDFTGEKLAKLFNVVGSTIYDIIKNKTWKNLDSQPDNADKNKNKKFTYNKEKKNINNYKKEITREMINEIHRLRNKGTKMTEISKRLNITYRKIVYILKNHKQQKEK